MYYYYETNKELLILLFKSYCIQNLIVAAIQAVLNDTL